VFAFASKAKVPKVPATQIGIELAAPFAFGQSPKVPKWKQWIYVKIK
jgi:hypothetical protein